MGVKCSEKKKKKQQASYCDEKMCLGSLSKQEAGTLQAWLPFLVKKEDRGLGLRRNLENKLTSVSSFPMQSRLAIIKMQRSTPASHSDSKTHIPGPGLDLPIQTGQHGLRSAFSQVSVALCCALEPEHCRCGRLSPLLVPAGGLRRCRASQSLSPQLSKHPHWNKVPWRLLFINYYNIFVDVILYINYILYYILTFIIILSIYFFVPVEYFKPCDLLRKHLAFSFS